jgi:hypothetical protein
MLRMAFREQTKILFRWTAPAGLEHSGGNYGSAFHCFGSGGVRDVFRGT